MASIESLIDIHHDREHPIPSVQNCGRTFAEATEWELRNLQCGLTEEEKASPYARYFQLGPQCPCDENLRATELGAAMDPALAFPVEEYVAHMNVEGSWPIKTGYCVLPNGVGFGTATTFQPGLTKEIMNFYIEHYNPPGDLFYKAWFPGAHIRHYSDCAVEDTGFGMMKMCFYSPMTWETLGMKGERCENDEYHLGISGSNGLLYPLHQLDKEPIYSTQLCHYRLTPEGYEERMTFWVGQHYVDGKTVLHLPNGKPVNEMIPAALARHSAWETATCFRNVMEFWKDHH